MLMLGLNKTWVSWLWQTVFVGMICCGKRILGWRSKEEKEVKDVMEEAG